MLPLRRAALAALSLLVAPQLAAAGPVEWSYTSQIRTTTGLGVLDLGTHRLYADPSGNGSGEPVFGDYTITAPLLQRNPSGTHLAHTDQTNESIPLLSVGSGFRTDPTGEAPPSDPGFTVTFTLTDVASGRSETVVFAGTAGVAAGPEFPPVVLFSLDMGPATTEMTLGGNRYRVTALGGLPDEIEEPALAGVRVDLLSPTAATPEPGTLALAGMGLAAVGLRFRRRAAK